MRCGGLHRFRTNITIEKFPFGKIFPWKWAHTSLWAGLILWWLEREREKKLNIWEKRSLTNGSVASISIDLNLNMRARNVNELFDCKRKTWAEQNKTKICLCHMPNHKHIGFENVLNNLLNYEAPEHIYSAYVTSIMRRNRIDHMIDWIPVIRSMYYSIKCREKLKPLRIWAAGCDAFAQPHSRLESRRMARPCSKFKARYWPLLLLSHTIKYSISECLFHVLYLKW